MAARAVALVIDGILAFVVLGEAIALLAGQEHHAHGSYGFSLHGGPAFAWLALAFAYWIVCERLFGATVGKRIFSLRVEGRAGGLPTWGQSVARNLLRIVDGFPYVLPYLVGFVIAKSNADRRRLGDTAAGTRVVSSS
jgi:uncharacterized RDD family membrane protein YckC